MIIQPLWAFILCMIFALIGVAFIGVVIWNLFGRK